MVTKTAKPRKPTSQTKEPFRTASPRTKISAAAAGEAQNTDQLDHATIYIRMYRVGFGDCFLLSLPVADGAPQTEGHVHVLIDCGVHPQGDIGTLEKAVDDIATRTKRKLAVIIATHAHRDHIAGFDKLGDKFSTFEIGEVWLPWTWNPDDNQAREMQKKQVALTTQLAEYFALGVTDPNTVSVANALDNLSGNEHAIALLKSGFGVGAKVRYMMSGDTWTSPAEFPITDLSVRILGPPRSEEFLAQMNPPPGEHYLRLSSEGSEDANTIGPFSQKWRLDMTSPELADIKLSTNDEKHLQDTLGSRPSDLAFFIDQARNNESLVTLFVFHGQYLLFPGDAQYGNWRWWLENLEPETILPQVGFYKVAHHGSVNATPKDALEKMSDGKFAAMVSTQSKPWASIPRVPLMSRLSEKAGEKVVRSDWLSIKGAPEPSPGTAPPVPQKLPEGFDEGPFWFDYRIKL